MPLPFLLPCFPPAAVNRGELDLCHILGAQNQLPMSLEKDLQLASPLNHAFQ